MKSRHSQTLSLLLILTAMIFTKGAYLCFGANQEFAVLLHQEVMQLETTWRKGCHRDYYAQIEIIMRKITMSNVGSGNLNSIAAKLLADILSRDADVMEVKTNDLAAMRQVALFSINSRMGISCEKHQANVRLLSACLGKIRKERVKDYNFKPVFFNVPQPLGVPGMAGMSPDAIKDPAMRTKYIEAIKENQRNNVCNARQAALAEIEKELYTPIVGYMIETVHACALAPALLRQCMDEAVLTDSEKKEILRQVGQQRGVESGRE
ncbi:MAG: hypothetical protein RBU24_15500 [Kiritimatiellia bacterium]|nr:hypothetical protein [Kiritimatiellia bacterium]NCB27550.1 hypothetical protein [Bacteroidia bacterium]